MKTVERPKDQNTYPEVAGALSGTAMGGSDGIVLGVGNGTTEVEAKVILERKLVGTASGHDLLAADNLAVILPDRLIKWVAHHEAGPRGGPDLAKGNGGQGEHKDGRQAEHVAGESEEERVVAISGGRSV